MPSDSGESSPRGRLCTLAWSLAFIPIVGIAIRLLGTSGPRAGFVPLVLAVVAGLIVLGSTLPRGVAFLTYLAAFALAWQWPWIDSEDGRFAVSAIHIYSGPSSYGLEIPEANQQSLVATLMVALAASALVQAIQAFKRMGWNLSAAIGLVGMGLVISRLSGEAGSPGWMLEFFRDALGFSQANAELATIIVRKTIHFTFYGVMALFAAIVGYSVATDRNRVIAFAALWTLGHAAFDEMRQNQTPSRTGTAIDVVLDLAGVAFVLFLWNRHQIMRKRR